MKRIKLLKRQNSIGGLLKTSLLLKTMIAILLVLMVNPVAVVRAENTAQEGLELDLVLLNSECVYGEPILVNLVARNTSKTKTVKFVGEDTFGFCGYVIKGVVNQNQLMKDMSPYLYGDGMIYPLSVYQCQIGQEVREQVILQRFVEFTGAGTYSVSCVYRTSLDPRDRLTCLNPHDIPIYSKTGNVIYRTNECASVSNRFTIVVTPFDEPKVMTVATQLFARLLDPDIKTRQDAVKAIAYCSGNDAVTTNIIAHLLPLLLDSNEKIQYETLESLHVIWRNPSALALPVTVPLPQRKEIVGILQKLIGNRGNPEAKTIALGKLGDEECIPYLIKMANSNNFDYRTREHIPYALEQIGLRSEKEKAIAALKILLNDPVAKIRQKAEQAIKRLEFGQ